MNKLTIAIFCKDNRGRFFKDILQQTFIEKKFVSYDIFWIRSSGDQEQNSVVVPSSSLPTAVDASIIHVGDQYICDERNISARYIFKFNALGQSIDVREKELSIYRQTSPNFEIYRTDISELVDYIANQTNRIPYMCSNILLDYSFSLALMFLCQGYLAVNPCLELQGSDEQRFDNVKLSEQTKDSTNYWQVIINSEIKSRDDLIEKISNELCVDNCPSPIIKLINGIYDFEFIDDINLIKKAEISIKQSLIRLGIE
jgi:hypothetical protein